MELEGSGPHNFEHLGKEFQFDVVNGVPLLCGQHEGRWVYYNSALSETGSPGIEMALQDSFRRLAT